MKVLVTILAQVPDDIMKDKSPEARFKETVEAHLKAVSALPSSAEVIRVETITE